MDLLFTWLREKHRQIVFVVWNEDSHSLSKQVGVLSPITGKFGFHELPPLEHSQTGLCICLCRHYTMLLQYTCVEFQSYAKHVVTPSGDRELVGCHNIGGEVATDSYFYLIDIIRIYDKCPSQDTRTQSDVF